MVETEGNVRSSTESTSVAKPVTIDDESDPDFDDLDDVLDQFSSAHDRSKTQSDVQPKQPTPSASGPGRPSASEMSSSAPPPLLAPRSAESEEDFMTRLASEMSSVLGNLGADPSSDNASAENMPEMGNKIDEFASVMEEQSVNPEDLLKAILGEAAGSGEQPANAGTTGPKAETSDKKPPRTNSSPGEKESFEETIRRTMERMQASDANATHATSQPATGAESEDDMLSSLLKAMETGGDTNSEESLSKVFLGMMEQLTNKEMLYEPMKELDSKYPEWLLINKAKLPDKDYGRYEGQRGVVREIVTKFEEKEYSDEDSSCREFIWERMQKMQDMGSPPEDLISNPFPGITGGLQGGTGKEDDSGCSMQ